MPSGREQISAAIKSVLEGISGVGSVLEFHRYTRGIPEKFRQYFTKLVSQEQQQVNVWLINRNSFVQSHDRMPIPQEMREHLFVITGYKGLRDEAGTESEFQDLIEDIVNALETRKQLGLSSLVEYVYPPNVPVIDHEMFGSAGCHHCEIHLRVLERRSLVYVS